MALNNGVSQADALVGDLPPADMISGGSEMIYVPASPGSSPIGGGRFSGPDDDFLLGSGNATLRGYGGDDMLIVDDLPDASTPVRTALLDGGSGADQLYIDFSPGRSTLLGGGGDDTLSVGYTVGMDRWDPVILDGGTGDDVIHVGCNGATVLGGQGNDTIEASGDGLVVKAGAGNDHIRVLPSHLGGNRITTGAGADVIELASWMPTTGGTVVTDFKAGAGGDRLDLESLYLLSPLHHRGDPFAAGVLRLTAAAGGTSVELDADGRANGASFQTLLVLKGVTPGSLTADNFVQPVQPLLSGNAALPQAQASKTLILDAGSAPVALGLSAPVDPDGGTLTITATTTPDRAQVLLDGQALHWGSALTAAQLTRLQVKLDPDANGSLGQFGYLVTDDEGSTIQRSVSFQVALPDAAPASEPAALQVLGAAQPAAGMPLSAADLFVI